MVRELDDFGGDATIYNLDKVCPIDIAITEDIKDLKLHFVGHSKYKNFDFSETGGFESNKNNFMQG